MHKSLPKPTANNEGVPTEFDSSLNETAIEIKQSESCPLDNSVTFEKALIQESKSSTPIRNDTPVQANDVQHPDSPKERIAKHGQSINGKLDIINVTLSTLDTSFKSFLNKLTELKSVTDNLVPSIKSTIPEMISTNQKFKHASQQIENMQNKIKHCNQILESLHTKVNLLDSQLKENSTVNSSILEKINLSVNTMLEFREENKESLELVSTKIQELEARINQLENRPHVDYESERYDVKGISHLDHTQNRKVSVCDYLILSDSILRRIIPKKFTPNGKTIKRFIPGGALTCLSFIQKNGEQFNPKKC